MINSRTKGKVAELEVVNLFKNAGYNDSHRSQQLTQAGGAQDSKMGPLRK